ncbi:MAG: phosphoribosylglycinamide formyltransferase [Porticoccus sp.]|jgi:phosphoribosylglycinamide formyltransferase 1|nr:phosphoribosylglycinamide formyltransferase [Porticoccus sp.]
MTTTRRSRLVILLSGSGSNLQALIDAINGGVIEADIAAVISNKPGALGLKRADDAGIKNAVIDNLQFSSRENFDQALCREIQVYKPDLVILAGFMRILTSKFVENFDGRILNIHPSLLPKYPGLHSHQKAIDAGDLNAGATVHFVTSKLDGGPPVLQAEVPIYQDDSAEVLARRVLTKEHQIYPLAVQWFCAGRLSLVDGKTYLDSVVLPKYGLTFTDTTTEK